MELEEMEEMLPTTQRKTIVDPAALVYLGIAVPKWGKTTFFCDVPDSLLIAFERGFQFQQTPTVFIDMWHDSTGKFEPYKDDAGIIHTTMTLLKKVLVNSDKYKFLILDTADMAAKKCTDYYLEKYRWQHVQDGGDYGRGYDIAQNTPFRQMVGALMGTGRGMAFTTHQAVNSTDMKKGKKVLKETTLPGGIYKFLHTQADVILHGSFGVRQKGNTYRDRIWQTEGDEETLAGNRARSLHLPQKYIVDPERPWAQWAEFFTNPELAQIAEEELMGASSRRARDLDADADEEETPKPKLSTLKKKR